MAELPAPAYTPLEPSLTGTSLRNRVFLIRHGLAESNAQDIIVSDPKDGVPSFGLVEKGKQQAKETAQKLETLLSGSDCEGDLAEKIVVVSSDFKRVLETAQIIHDHFKVKTPIRTEVALRERGFGEYHLVKPAKSVIIEVFTADFHDPTHTKGGCESVTEMVIRMSRILAKLDEEFTDKILFLVSHGDPLQTLWALFKGVPPNERWTRLEHFKNCDIRELA